MTHRHIDTLDNLKSLFKPHSADAKVTLKIDNYTVQTPLGNSVLQAAEHAGIRIPRLCHLPVVPARATCRLCLVKINGMPNLVSSCSTMAREGMVVHTHSPEIDAIRRTIMDLTLLEHGPCGRPHCEVEELARWVGAEGTHFPPLPPAQVPLTVDSAYLHYDPTCCVRCDRCIQTCYLHVLARGGRGSTATLTFDGEDSPSKSRCTACGDCIAICPGGALSEVDPGFRTRS